MSVIVLLEFQIKAEAVEAMKTLMSEVLTDTRSYPGCEGLDVGTDADNPASFIFCERWASREHYDRYLSWRTATGMMERFGGHLAGPPSIRYFHRAGI